MNTITVTIKFNSAFRIATGQADDKADQVLDHGNPLPGRSLKGDLRAAARQLLPATQSGDDTWRDDPLVEEVFGAPGGDGCPWHFGDGVLNDVSYRTRARIALDPRRRVRPGAMLIGEEARTTVATQTISQTGTLTEEQRRLHGALLRVSATLIDGVGHGRRRGMGWVSVTTDSERIEDDVNLVMRYVASRRES
ncbi:CRISPR/Cas system CSM-associated protein Csm3, group 7 of RAMP superfamily [Tessaracoccus bendigoensis DSM 12906]|uniref:CRISPR/Cas system CSM-associated protein Csm3, group 7 of RAMP superfamily n=1 Tax=Tessaracoccus bendigoensis DSM 12906 TaxID=1123357 RepID=A0A1M6N224_9ACTN|nr:RAMP superfamily CRISPR-associated protein [Tessaracoccus bendigoensis]SHJ89732.1 CRISPR/Cas system CSM-associated protein Csm3, group 7 of RAMP superfamily [Tessaracoccus bendigoensis DSM 12906]